MLLASLSGGCTLFGASPPPVTVVDASCDFRHVRLPGDLKPRFYETDERIKAGLSAEDRAFAVNHKGNNSLRHLRCGEEATQQP